MLPCESCDRLRIHAVTFNMNSMIVPQIPSTILQLPLNMIPSTKQKGDNTEIDMYVIGTQENGSWMNWEKSLTNALGPRYQKLAGESLMAIHIVVFIRAELKKEV